MSVQLVYHLSYNKCYSINFIFSYNLSHLLYVLVNIVMIFFRFNCPPNVHFIFQT